MARLIPSEHEEQKTLFEWAAYHARQYPELYLLFAIPNGGLRSPKTGARLKAEGVKAGVPDLMLPVARGGYHGLFVEMKAGRGRATRVQRVWADMLAAEGYRVALCRGWEEAARVILAYLQDERVLSGG